MIFESVKFPHVKKEFLKSSILIGLGNPDRMDDGIGIYCAEKIRWLFYNLKVFTENTDLIDEVILQSLGNPKLKNFFFIDSCNFGGKPGDIMIVDRVEDFIEEISTHKFPLSLYMKMLQRAGKRVKVIGIQIKSIDFRKGLTLPVSQVLDYDIITVFDDLIEQSIHLQEQADLINT